MSLARLSHTRLSHTLRALRTRALFSSQPSVHVDAASEPAAPAGRGGTSTLGLPGGTRNAARRDAEGVRIAAALRRTALPRHGRIAAADVLWCSDDVCFVGVGARTNWRGFHAALAANVFGTRRVLAVRDCFDRDDGRAVLADFCALAADDVLAVTRPVVKRAEAKRLVNEYARPEGAEEARLYRLVKNDVSYVSWIHSNGFRLLAVDDAAALAGARAGDVPTQQSSNHCLMVAPTAFEFNVDAAGDNYFMDRPDTGSVLQVRRNVLREHAALYDRLTDRVDGVGAVVHLFTHEDWHGTPDALFPNNCFSTHTAQETGDSNASIVLYPMRSPSRRRERRPEFVSRLLSFGRYATLHDLSRHEVSSSAPSFLEGTGSMVLDRRNRVAYLAVSPRSDPALAKTWGRIMDYSVVPFDSVDAAGNAIYHTNVMMAIGTHAAVVCSAAIPDPHSRAIVLDALRQTGHRVVDISLEQVASFCGNILEMENYYGEPMFVMSSAAYHAFTQEQREVLGEASAGLVHSDIETIERVGGGGVRCSIAELF